MAVLVTVNDVEWAPAWEPVAPLGIFGDYIDVADTVANGDTLVTTQWAASAGQVDDLAIQLDIDGTNPPMNVQFKAQDLDDDGAELAMTMFGPWTVTNTVQEVPVVIPAAPSGTRGRRLSLLTNEPAPGYPIRTNWALDPRGMNTAHYSPRLSWPITSGTGAGTDIGGVTGLNSAVTVSAPAATSYTDAGINLYGDPDAQNPPDSIALESGVTWTVSAWVFSSRAFNAAIRRRFATETGGWAVAATTSSSTAVAAGTWTRISSTFTVPAGAPYVALAFIAAGSFATAVGTTIRVTGVLIEPGATAGTYFDGDTTNGLSGSSRWSSVANQSLPVLYAAGLGLREIQVPAGKATRAAAARELIGAALERDLRRSIADLFLARGSLVTAGVPGLLSGTLTLLCDSWWQAQILDELYQLPGRHVLVTGEDEPLDGLVHIATERLRIVSEAALPGQRCRWRVEVTVREMDTE